MLSIDKVLFALPSGSPPRNIAGHWDLTQMSSDIKYALPESETNGLKSVMDSFPGGYEGFKNFLSSANIFEDGPAGLYGLFHFYDPTTGKGYQGIPYNAKNRANDLYQDAVYTYCEYLLNSSAYYNPSALIKNAWGRFGRASHPVQDMVVPAHSNLIPHIYPPDAFEKYVRDNWDRWHPDTPNEGKIIKGHDSNGNPIYYTGLKDYLENYLKRNPYNPGYQLNSVSEYINELAKKSRNYPVDDRDDPNGEISWEEKRKNAQDLLPLAMMYGAGLINTFWKDMNTSTSGGIPDVCKRPPVQKSPGGDHADDRFDVSDEFYLERYFDMSLDKLTDLNMRTAMKKGKIGVYYLKQVIDTYIQGMTVATDAERQTAQNKLNELGKVTIPNSARFQNDFKTAPDIALFAYGYYNPSISLMLRFKEPVAFLGLDFDPQIVKDHPVIITPSGGLFGLENSQMLKAQLDEYVKNGGTLIVFAQQHGYEFSILPVPQEADGTYKTITGYGWTEDQSCLWNGTYVDTWHQIFSGIYTSTPSANVDGYFTDYPSSATVLLRRIKNGQPAMLMYEYGNGRVIVSSLFTDWGYAHSQATQDELKIVRDMISWAKKPEH